MVRVVFNSTEHRLTFFDKLNESFSFNTWKDFYNFHGINCSVFFDYKNGRLSIPKEIYEQFLSYFNAKEKKEFIGKVTLVNDNWGRVKGGKKTYSLHKNIFDKGRKKGMSKINEKRKNLLFDWKVVKIDEELSYFIGLFIGDGFANKYGSHYLTQFVGHKTEFNYYNEIILELVKRKFELEGKIKTYDNGNFIRVNFYSKSLFELLTKGFRIPAGRKSRIIKIPKKILNSNKKNILSFIAGVYDAEGCIFFDKRKNYSKPYPRIDLHMQNFGILLQIKSILDENNIISSFANKFNDNSRILIYGHENVKKFVSRIPLKNPKHLIKLGNFNL